MTLIGAQANTELFEGHLHGKEVKPCKDTQDPGRDPREPELRDLPAHLDFLQVSNLPLITKTKITIRI